MSVIIRLQNLPWSANALDIRNFFRGLSIPEGGVHIVGGEQGDAFIAFSTDEDARQAMMLDGGKIKEIQVKLLLSSRSEMHKVIEAARQNVPILTLTAPAPTPASVPAAPVATVMPTVSSVPLPITVTPSLNPFSTALGANSLSNFGIPGIGNPQEIPQPAVIEVPGFNISPPVNVLNTENDKEEEKLERKRSAEKERRRSRSRSRSRDRKDRKRDRRDRSRSRERRRRERSRSRDRRDRKRDRKERSRSRERSPSRTVGRSRDRRPIDRKSPNSQERVPDVQLIEPPVPSHPAAFSTTVKSNMTAPLHSMMQNGPLGIDTLQNRFNDPSMNETLNKIQELGKKRNPNAFQGDANGGAGRFQPMRGGIARGGATSRREGRPSRFDMEPQRDCCVAIRNAPNHTSYGDVRRFFPYMIDKHGIKMINDNMGRRTGNIYVRFCEIRSKQLALQRRVNELKGEHVIVEPLDDDVYDNGVDSFLPYREENDDDESVANTDIQKQESFSVLKLTDLPNFVKEHDIIKAFSDFSLLSIMLTDCRETRTKVAHVQFVKPEDARIAYDRKDRYLFGRRQPTITPVTNDDYEKEKTIQVDKNVDSPQAVPIDQPQEIQPPRDPRQRRLPPQTLDNGSPGPVPITQNQANSQGNPFFAAGNFVPPSIYPSPFPAPQFGGFPAPVNLDPRTASNNWPPPRPLLPMQNPVETNDTEDEPLDCVLMKGLPHDATDRTIVSFLADTGAVPARIHLMLDPTGLPSGDCFCEFRTTHEARRAAANHGKNLDGGRVTVDLVTRTVVEEALEGPKIPDLREGLLTTPPQFFESPNDFGLQRPFRGRGGFDRGFGRGTYRGGFDQPRGFRGRGGWSDRGRGGFDSRGGYDSRGGFERGRGRGFVRGRGGFENGRERREIRTEEDSDATLEDFGAPGCVVSMENVPFRASVDDIMNFFSEFELTQDDIIRRYNERGMPTGDARVAFRTPFDAQRAVKTRHMDMVLDRRVSLAIL